MAIVLSFVAWGEWFHKLDPHELAPLRFIPTRVGNGSSEYGWRRIISVHPHACGERGKVRTRRESITIPFPRTEC